MVAPPSAFDAVLHRMYQREGVESLPDHLQQAHGITATKVAPLDVGVFRIDRGNEGASLVVRLFAAGRPRAAVEGDLAVLRYLESIGFPAERPFGGVAFSSHEGQWLLVTEFVKQVAKAQQPPHPIVRLGAIVGRLHGLPVPEGAGRPAGALHHFAEGTVADELGAVTGWLDAVAPGVPIGNEDALAALRAAVVGADGGEGLPEALVHPDPVPKNAIFTADGPVLVDWTAAGRGPRLASMALMLRSSWAAVPFLKGYARRITLTDDERERLPALLFSRQLIDLAFRTCRDPTTVVTAPRRLTALRRGCDTQARELLAVLRQAP